MHLFFIFVLCAGLFATYTQADEDNEVKRGAYPYMAFVYYPDKKVADRTGARLVRGAVLIRPEWLISSSLEDGKTPLAFPKETLVARLGAIRIDSRFTFNEDEEEQEREVVQIARPYNYSSTEWWVADISLLKTLLPFNITEAVAPVAINASPEGADKGCFILIYSSPNGNKSGEKMLMIVSIELLSPNFEECGSNFVKNSMICATDSDDFKKEPSFCEGNSGSPLICDRAVVGIQTYINDCKPPHLYQYLNSWDNLITCAVEDKCKEEQCSTICKVINKDPVNLSSQRTLLAEAKVYQEEIASISSNEANLNSTVLKGPSPGSKTIPDDFQNDMKNTETTTSSSSTVVYNTEKELFLYISSETDMAPSAVTRHANKLESGSTITSSPTSNTEIDSSQPIYKTEDLMHKVEELKTYIDENIHAVSDNVSVQQDQHKVRSAAAATTQSIVHVMSYLILFYLQFSFIHSC